MTRTKKRALGAKKRTDTDSRNGAISRKRKATATNKPRDSQAPAKKRRKRDLMANHKQEHKARKVGEQTLGDSGPAGAAFSSASSFPNTARSSLEQAQMTQDRSDTSRPNLGSNRLRSGFMAATRFERSASHPGTPSDGEDAKSAISISDEDEDGGMILNLDGSHAPIVISDDDMGDEIEEQEDGEIHTGSEPGPDTPVDNNGMANAVSMQVELSKTGVDENVSFVVDTKPSMPQVYLKDLTEEQLAHQFTYVFWHLPRDQLDLNRLARCLNCSSEGHIDEHCPEKTCSHCGSLNEHTSELCPRVRRCETCREPGPHSCSGMKNTTIPCDICSAVGHVEDACPIKHYAKIDLPEHEKPELWFSCCLCASREHFVGDCHMAPPSKAARWSLRALKLGPVTNMSTQSVTQKLERDAQNRGMRPEGLKIRGRAAQQYRPPSSSKHFDSSDSGEMEGFLSRPPVPRNARRQAPTVNLARPADQYRPSDAPRYDRFEPPRSDEYRPDYRPPRNDFYATDSFGRPRSRSRSPPRFENRTRERTPERIDSYRPQFDRDPPPQRPALTFSINLPERRGPNPKLNSTANPRRNQTTLPPKPPAQPQSDGQPVMSKFAMKHNGIPREKWNKMSEQQQKDAMKKTKRNK